MIDLCFECFIFLPPYRQFEYVFPPKTYFIFMHFWAISAFIRIFTNPESCPIKSGIARLYRNKIVHPNPKNLNRLLQHCYVVNKVLHSKFCEDLQHLKPRGVGPVRLSMFEISKVPPTPTLVCSGGNLRTIVVSNLAWHCLNTINLKV